MALLLDDTNYLEKTTDSDWGATGTIFIRIRPHFTIADGVNRAFIGKTRMPFTLNFFQIGKNTLNNMYIGFYDGAEYRISGPAASTVMATDVWSNHLYTWDAGVPNQEYYADNVPANFAPGAPISVPTGLSRIRLGCIDTGTPDQSAMADMCEHGRWSRVLTAGERQVLQVTGCPLFVPRGLVEYHPMTSLAGGGRDLFSNTHLTPVGSPTEVANPYRIRPESGRVAIQPAAPLPLEILPPLISNAFQIFQPTVATAGQIIEPPLISNSFTIFSPTVAAAPGIAPPLISNSFTIYPPAVHIQESVIQEDLREIEPHNLKVRIVDFVAGDDLRITRTYTDLAEGITISKAYLTIKRRAVDDADAAAIIQKTITTAEQMSGSILDNDTTGGSIELYFDLSNTETALLTPLIPYQYDIQVITTGSAIYTCEKGVIVMAQGVTEATS